MQRHEVYRFKEGKAKSTFLGKRNFNTDLKKEKKLGKGRNNVSKDLSNLNNLRNSKLRNTERKKTESEQYWRGWLDPDSGTPYKVLLLMQKKTRRNSMKNAKQVKINQVIVTYYSEKMNM